MILHALLASSATVPPEVIMRSCHVLLLLGALALPVSAVSAQQSAPPAHDDSTRATARLAPITVSATRSATLIFQTTTPVLSIDSSVIRHEVPNGIGDLFRNLPGVDVTGVGPNQERIIIRGQTGQRILLAEDGLRMNNARRQVDFGELSSLTDINQLSRVEIVRGPASVLYGTDAIGGVVNQITLEPPRRGRSVLLGSMLYRYSSADAQNLGHLSFSGREGRLGFTASAGRRGASNYLAPAGSFGNLTFATPQLVNDVGVRDRNYAAKLSYDVGENSRLAVGMTRYESRDAGFGYVDPSALGDSSGVLVRLLYPDQVVNRVTASFQASALPWGLADRLSLATFTGSNKRNFNQQIDIPFGAPLPPTAGMAVRSYNFTDIGSYGARLELTKVIAGRHTLVYGADWYLDHSVNTDSSVTTTTVYGPPSVTRSTTPSLPDANFATAGLFAQSDFAVAPRLTMSAGARAQTIHASTRATPGLPADRAGVDASNGALVGNLSARFAASSRLNLVATVGRGFRAPNLIERYFDGATAEGNGYQVASPALAPETSLNTDIGFKYRTDRIYAEATYFRNTIHDGIRAVALGTTVGNFPAYQNQNIATLRDRGVEALAEVKAGRGFAVLAHATTLKSINVDRSNPVGDSYGSKVGGELSWRDPHGRMLLAYEIRHQGVRKDIDLGTSPVGAVLPAFTVHAIRGSYRLPQFGLMRPELEVAVNNLTDVLYAEASNTSFFRPEPRRSLTTALRLDF
jgi:hemoglobin/transferrin/lactoferrin receptor protein